MTKSVVVLRLGGMMATCLLQASLVSAQSTATIQTRLMPIDKPGLYTVHAPRQMNLELGILFKSGARGDTVEAFKEWLTQEGLRITDDESVHGFVDASGDADAVESAFHVQIMMTQDGKQYGPLEDAKIPSEFANVVQSIFGLSSMSGSARPAKRVAHPPTAMTPPSSSKLSEIQPAFLNGVNAFGPYDLRTFYDATTLINSGIDGSGVDCIAFAEDSLFSSTAVQQFNTTFSPNLPSTNLTSINVGSGQTTNGDQDEALIDIEWAHAIAPGAALHVYIGPPGASGFMSALEQAITDDTCGTIDVSYTLCGSSAVFTGLDPFFRQAARQRQAIFVSTGDQGAAEGTLNSNACPQLTAGVKELAADAYVTAVGGTQFIPTYNSSGNDVGFVSESVWNDASGASGGGLSAVFNKPTYQAGIAFLPGQPAALPFFRAIPDVAMGASPNTPGFWTVLIENGTPTLTDQYAGTSLAAPVWSGIGALLANKVGHRIGNINSRLYQMELGGQMGLTGGSVGLRDVTSGNNTFGGVSGVSAYGGYDEASGWGTPDVGTMAGQFLGTVLISGGEANTTVSKTAEIYNFTPPNGAFTFTNGNMTSPRMCHTSTLLPNGQTLIAGGAKNNSGVPISAADLFTPSKGTFASTASMANPRADHQAVLLANGSVLIVGGYTTDDVVTASAEIYTPFSGRFSKTGSMNISREDFTATLLSNGTVLVVRGVNDSGDKLSSAEIYNPSSGQFTLLASKMTTARVFHTAVLLDNGMVLLTGGENNSAFLASAELFDPVHNTFAPTASMNSARVLQVSALLHDGRVLVAGGATKATAEIYDPVAGSFGTLIAMSAARQDPAIATLADGRVLVAGGSDSGSGVGSLSSAEVFDPSANAFSSTQAPMNEKRWRTGYNYSQTNLP